MQHWSVTFWIVVVTVGAIGSVLGVIISNFFPGWKARERFTSYPKTAGIGGALVSFLPAGLLFPDSGSLILSYTFLTGLVVAYLTARLPRINQFLEKQPAATPSQSPTNKITANQMCFRKDWNVRPRFETEETGLFVGRNEFLERLNSHFISRSGGTILISGVRGVGKTALVDRALVTSRRELQDRYWKATWEYLTKSPWWCGIDRKARRTLLESEGRTAPDTAENLKAAAERYSKTTPRWWHKFDPVDRRIRRWHKASRWQLLVLKFSASDISGALPEPGQLVTGKPRINPEKLLRSIIRKLYVTFDPSRSVEEAEILQWSLRDKAKRKEFFDTLNAAYNKSISKSYKEIISNTISDLLKRTQSSTWEGKINVEKVGLVLLCVAIGVVFSQFDPGRAWRPLEKLIGYGVPGAITGYVLLSWGWKRTREKSSDQSRQSSFSYEYDYSLHQMRQDLESLVRILSPIPNSGREEESDKTHDPFRCFRRTVLVFDELDKLEQADQQLDDIITHFKNFFTLSEAVFVFLTDHEFYEHLTRETIKAQLARHYPPQHTFFTEKIYLRKPEFVRFREAFFRFTEDAWIEGHTRSLPADAMLMDDLLKRDEKNVKLLPTLPPETLAQLYVQRRQYKDELAKAIESAFQTHNGMSEPMTVAQIWAGEATRSGGDGDFAKLREDFTAAGGWQDPQALSFLYHQREDLFKDDKQKIEDSFADLKTNFLNRYDGVDDASFTLSDLARALCFQTRNHYFDLYNSVYDYVASYNDGAPVLEVDGGRYARDPKLWSRYQQLLEIAFDTVRENHPSREYFNALLMESLYRAFDKRATGEKVKIAEILFPPRDEIAAVAKTMLEPEKSEAVAVTPVVEGEGENFQHAFLRLMKLASDKLAALQTAPEQQNGSKIQVQPYTDRDAEKINRAIIRLLRLALAHNAIREVTPGLRTRLNNVAKPESLEDLEFAWNDNSYSIIRSVIREQHEQELINFWKDHGSELDAFDLELGTLWSAVEVAGESARIRAAIGELRTRAEVVGLGQGTISGPDAAALKVNVGTWESREALWPRIILDRIRAEDDANVVEVFDRPQTSDPSILLALQRKTQIETRIGSTVRGIISPHDTKWAMYLVVGPASGSVNLLEIKSLLPENTSLFWYVTGKKAASVSATVPDGIYLYASPSSPLVDREGAAKLIKDYTTIASQQRLETIINQLRATQYKDAQLAQRAGAEVLGRIVSVSGIFYTLGQPDFDLAVRLLKEKRERFGAVGLADWTDLTTNWSAGAASKRLVDEIVAKGNFKAEFRQIIDEAVSDLFISSATANPDTWLKTFMSATEEPNAIWMMLLKSTIKAFMRTRMDDAKVTDQSARSAINEHFVPWLANTIQSVLQSLNIEEVSFFTLIDAVGELENKRKALRTPVRPAPPGAPNADAPAGLRRRRK